MRKRAYVYLALILFLCSGLWYSYYQFYNPPTRPIERDLGATIPVDAMDVEAEYRPGFQSASFNIQFKVPPQSFATLLSQICGDVELSPENNWRQN